MSDLLDLIAEADAYAKHWGKNAVDGKCRHCGTPVSPISPTDMSNHGNWGDTCTSRGLSRSHARRALYLLDPANRTDADRCSPHSSSKKPCKQSCFDQMYERRKEMADRVWGADGWKEQP